MIERNGRTAGAKRAGAAGVAAAVVLLAFPATLSGQASELDVKAAFLYHFTQYVEWPAAVPASAGSPFVIGVLGDGGFRPVLAAVVKDKSVAGRRIVVKPLVDPAEARGCQMVFVASSEAARVAAVLDALDGLPVLAVSDVPGFALAGGAIGFVSREGRVAFQINPDAAGAAGLRISSKLLRLAEIVDAD